ncbi:hypothetical protein [Spirosoma panaciterrae]|uniref:hypothetical protein n=1 Tax=Spirosoma panaciterrae TaxID=496058 RepID=UPI000378AFD1|nr:hypothetical protein [Spirosoma panaciterrae]
MKNDLIQITLNDDDEAVLQFSVSETERTLEQKLLGAFLRKAGPKGIRLHLKRTYKDADEKLHYDYEIRPIQSDEINQGTTE